jgi:hypothetical protein
MEKYILAALRALCASVFQFYRMGKIRRMRV